MLREFREFIAKGNVIDLAVGIVIGAAFTAIVNSFVNDLLNPIIGVFGGANFDHYFLYLRRPPDSGLYMTPDDAQKAGAVTLNYGKFFTASLNFLIVGFVMFLVVKAANKLRRKQEEAPKVEPTPADVALLTEIRDLLANRA
jgi:large conductance mechanosensitive channel